MNSKSNIQIKLGALLLLILFFGEQNMYSQKYQTNFNFSGGVIRSYGSFTPGFQASIDKNISPSIGFRLSEEHATHFLNISNRSFTDYALGVYINPVRTKYLNFLFGISVGLMVRKQSSWNEFYTEFDGTRVVHWLEYEEHASFNSIWIENRVALNDVFYLSQYFGVNSSLKLTQGMGLFRIGIGVKLKREKL